MGSPRASSDRQRRSDKTCWKCGSFAKGPPPERERLCAQCGKEVMHEVYMRYELRGTFWCVTFEEKYGFRRVGNGLTFRDADKIMEMVEKTPTSLNLEKKQAIEMGIQSKKGGTEIKLTDEQYQRLKGP